MPPVRNAGVKPAAAEDDATIKIVREVAKPARPRGNPGLLLAGAVVVGFTVGGLAWVLWPRSAPPAGVAQPAVPANLAGTAAGAPAGPLEFPIETATEAQIRDNVSASLNIFRVAANPDILVLDFASLRDQGLMLNRIGAFAEKANLPHDRILPDKELDQAIVAGGDTIETFYYGHDYSAATLARFFATADRDHIQLNPDEEMLRRLLRQVGWFAPGKNAGLISIPRTGADPRVTAAARATILHHELSHGEYFSNPAYAAYVHQFWTSVLTASERAAVRDYLRSEAYDTTIEELTENEAQAYLIFTEDPEFFTPSMVGMTQARRAELRAIFMRDMPAPWLQDDQAAVTIVRTGAGRR